MDLGPIFKMQNDTQSSSSQDDEIDFLDDKPAVVIPYMLVIVVMMTCGTVGNILVIGSVLVNKHLKTVGNVFIVNLALADLCVTGFVDPFSIVGVVRGRQWFVDRPFLCNAVGTICLTSCFCSLLTIGSISFNRYIHICHNDLYRRIYTLPKSLAMCLGLWMICVIFESPNLFGWGDYNYDAKTLICVWDRLADFSYTLFFAIAGVTFPVVLISICYYKIYPHVRESKRKVAAMMKVDEGSGGAAAKQRESQESMKLARTLFIIFIVFAMCWSPHALIVTLDVNDTYPQALHLYFILMAHANSSLNSIVYGVTNRHFRRSYRRLLHIDWLLLAVCKMAPPLDENTTQMTQQSVATRRAREPGASANNTRRTAESNA